MNEAGSSRAEHRTGAAEEIAQLHADKAVLHDRLLRALADIENTRRRGERAATDAAQFAISDFARDILTVVDALKRALVAAESHATAENSIIDGVEATRAVLMAVLARQGIRPIDAAGKLFDPRYHEAVQEVEEPSREPGTVLEVIEDGYTIRDRLLRPARVVVAKRPGEGSVPGSSQEKVSHS